MSLGDTPIPLTDFSGTLERDTVTMETTLGQHTSSELVPYGVSLPTVVMEFGSKIQDWKVGSTMNYVEFPVTPSLRNYKNLRVCLSLCCFFVCWCFDSFHHLYEWKKKCLG